MSDERPRPEPRFGIYVDQWAKPLDRVVDEFRMVDELGFDYAWLSDHLGAPGITVLESWTLLAALATQTSRVRLGVLVSSNTLRHPALLLKEAVTVDHLSGGRLILGIGTGWEREEHARYGIPFPDPRERVGRLEEAVTLMRLLMGQDRTTFEGHYYQLTNAPLDPKPVQQPRIPILVAAHRPRALRVAARLADIWDTYAAMDDSPTAGLGMSISDQMRLVDAECAAIGRDPNGLRRSTWTTRAALESVDAFRNYAEGQLLLGFTDISVLLPERWDERVIAAIARDVVPDLRLIQ